MAATPPSSSRPPGGAPDPAAWLVPPRYGTRSLADLLPAVIAAMRPDGHGEDDPAAAAGHDGTPSLHRELAGVGQRVVVLVVDGLGTHLLGAHAAAAPTLVGCPGSSIDAVFPTTTVASLASIGTGRTPAAHGMVGYCWPIADHHHPLNGLQWRIGLRGGGFDARTSVVPEAWQPEPTALERAVDLGIGTTVVLASEHLDSGLTRAALRGGQRVRADGLAATLARAVDEVARADAPALAYAHHPLVDWAGHAHGPDSDEVRDAIADVDRELARLQRSLPDDVVVLVTADHGFVGVAEDEFVELADHPALLDGVRVVAGEPRARHLALEAGADVDEVVGRWRGTLGDVATVLPRDDAMRLFGPSPVARARAVVGDVVVVARVGALVHRRVDPHGGRMTGHHGALTAAERLVPLRRLGRLGPQGGRTGAGG